MRTIRRLPDPEAVTRAAAQDLVELAQAAIDERGRFCVALSGGSTPRRLYEILAEAPRWAQIDWRRVEFFWGDERAVPPEHPVELANLHADLWWGGLMAVVGTIYCLRFHPWRKEK